MDLLGQKRDPKFPTKEQGIAEFIHTEAHRTSS